MLVTVCLSVISAMFTSYYTSLGPVITRITHLHFAQAPLRARGRQDVLFSLFHGLNILLLEFVGTPTAPVHASFESFASLASR